MIQTARADTLRTASVYAPSEPSDGLRVLVMRLWPRGIPRGDIRLWLKDLGPPASLIRGFKSGRLGWGDFKQAYLRHLRTETAQRSLEEIRLRTAVGPVTLLCGCQDESRCHRILLAAALRR